ncbi:hypothetical protein C2W62_42065 [Candidatus Entotheonella serta]|nr:hypothetical protein C2W62_42065 [Candidatus Entotheonella serta]
MVTEQRGRSKQNLRSLSGFLVLIVCVIVRVGYGVGAGNRIETLISAAYGRYRILAANLRMIASYQAEKAISIVFVAIEYS